MKNLALYFYQKEEEEVNERKPEVEDSSDI
jgi:hypothetical protein